MIFLSAGVYTELKVGSTQGFEIFSVVYAVMGTEADEYAVIVIVWTA